MSTTVAEFQEEWLAGWGNLPRLKCAVADPRNLEQLRSTIVGQANQLESEVAPRGLGRSYGDSSLHDRVIRTTECNRFLEFDRETGEIRCQAGVSLAEVIDVALPHGWFLPTTPGTKFVTLGGAVAADVHGKNHHRDGSFGNFVQELLVLLASGEEVHCSSTKHADVFWATIGGMGLTGLILEVQLQLRRVESAFC